MNCIETLIVPAIWRISILAAAKIGIQYVFPTQTTVSAIYERMKRKIPADLEFQNERSRSGYWLALTQALSAKDDLSFGWAHANATPGDPGQHNNWGSNPDSAANMCTPSPTNTSWMRRPPDMRTRL